MLHKFLGEILQWWQNSLLLKPTTQTDRYNLFYLGDTATLIVQQHWNCASILPSPSVSIQTSQSCSFWNSVCIYWSDNILGDILDIFLRIFAPLGISCTKWRHKIVITKIIIDHKLISKVVFTATSFPVLEDHLWLFPFPISPPPCLSSPVELLFIC